MKKFLTVLLALSVVFTYTVGTAFAAIPTEDQQAAKDYIELQAQSYLDGDFEQAVSAYMAALTFDKNDKLLENKESDLPDTYTGILAKDLIQAAATDVLNDAKLKFAADVAAYKDSYVTDNDALDKNDVIVYVKGLFNDVIETYVSDNAIGLNYVDADSTGVQARKALIEKQYKVEKALAEAALVYDLTKYSNDVEDWSISNLTNYIEYDAPADYTWEKLVGTVVGPLTAREFVEAIVKEQSKVVATTPDAKSSAYAEAIAAMDFAATIAKDFIMGHKIATGENYYIDAVPTIADLEDTTSLEAAKASAIKEVEAALISKTIELENALNTAIAAYDKQASLSTSDKENLKGLNEAKANLDKYITATKDVYTAQINYQDTIAGVKAKLNDYLGADRKSGQVASLAVTTNGFTAVTENDIFKVYVRMLDDVQALKDEASLLLQKKDVNGKPYYDADTLNSNLEKAIKTVITTGAEYKDVVGQLAQGQERALLTAKRDYINFIEGTATANFVPKDSKGKNATLWNKSNAEANVNAVLKDYSETIDVMYDEAQATALDALVENTTASIKAATTVAEIEKIFAEANDEYVAIPTTAKHAADWTTTGKLYAAFDKASYATELNAYVQYFLDTKVATGEYPKLNKTAILAKIVYPIVYEAYTTNEIAGKVAEAKAAIDKIATKAEVADMKSAVQALVDALPGTITVADKDAVLAAKDAYDDFMKIPGATEILNKAKLTSAMINLEKALADALEDAYDALADKKAITTDDKEAVEALRADFDAYNDFVTEYNVASTLATKVNETNVADFETKLLAAQVKAVKEMLIKLPANPTEKDRAQVEAARSAFDALPLDEQLNLIDDVLYKDLIDAEEALDVNAIKAVEGLKINTWSSAVKGKITIKWNVKGDASAADGYQVYKSTKAQSGYAYMGKTTKNYMANKKNLKKGKRYFYKVRAYKVIDGVKYYSDWSNKANRFAK